MNFRTFSILYFIFFFLGIAILFAFLFLLSCFFEHNNYSQIVQYQIKNNAIYGSALNENYFQYRLELIKAQKPDIVAIGSSRVGQFKQDFFNTSFVAAANGGNSMAETQYFVEQLLKIYHPKLIILGIDPWWFNAKMPNNKYASYQRMNGRDITTLKIFQGIKIIFSHPKQFFEAISSGKTTTNPYTNLPSLGFRAFVKSDGSFIDGSYLYFSTLSGIFPADDRKFQNSIYRISNEIFPFYYGNKIDPTRTKELISTVDLIRKYGIDVIVLTTPLAPSVYNMLIQDKDQRFSYLYSFSNFAIKNNIYNFFNPQTLTTTDCEFYDGFHGGDVVYARILSQISKENSMLAHFVNLSKIQQIINSKKGHAYSGDLTHWKETDFLELGCKK
ncbi:MAG TPA: hypothetical protein IAA23_01985 [Candidatus Helicobacter avistercoris]|nr:hypothetical protein [Candidatus Helicobacter avistercoris]